MKHKLTLIFIAFSVAFVTEAYEVNTHQAITHCALARSDKCGQEPATNLLYFAEALEKQLIRHPLLYQKLKSIPCSYFVRSKLP